MRKSYSGQVLASLGLKGDSALDRIDDAGAYDSPTIDKHVLAVSGAPEAADGPGAATPVTEPESPTATVATGTGAVSLTTAGTAATENFNTLAQTGTSSTLPTGWFFSETGTAENALYTAGTGTGTGGDTYSFGSTTAPGDRALGQVRSGSNVVTLGAAFTNNTGGALGALTISYTGEQWRFGAVHSTTLEKMDFQISFDATSLTTGTWTDVNALDFNSPINTGPTGQLDGNNAANRTALSATISSLNIGAGATFWIRWLDVDAQPGADDGLAIDDFSITGIAAVANNPGSLTIADVSLAEGNSGVTNMVFTVTRAGGSNGAVSATYTIANGTTDASDFGAGFVATASVSFADGETSKQILVPIQGDATTEPDETFTVTLSAPTGGATLGAQTVGTGTILNDDGTIIPAGTFAAAYSVAAAGTYILLANTTRTQTAGNGVTVSSATGATVNINGSLIDNATGARAINVNTGTTGTTINIASTGTVQSLNAEAVRNQTVNGTTNLNNLGSIIGTSTVGTPSVGGTNPGNLHAVVFTNSVGTAGAPLTDLTSGGTITNGSASVTTALIRSDNGDAVRLGSHQTLVNYGTINGNGPVNDASTNNSLVGLSTAQTYGASRGVRLDGTSTAVRIDNYNAITGAQHGVDVGDAASTGILVNNFAGGSIIGRNGSGVGADTTGAGATTVTVVNSGIIRGDYAPTYDRAGYTTVDGDGDGVDIDGGATITNNAGGQILGTGAGGFDSNGRSNNSEGISIGGGSITNAGIVRGANFGIVVNNDSNANGSRSGVAATTIVNAFGGAVTGDAGYAIRLENKAGTAIDADTIYNYGTITGNGTVPTGTVTIQGGAADTSTVGTLDGVTYTAVDAGNARFIRGDGAAIQTGEGDDVLYNYGSIVGNSGRAINMEGGNDQLVFNTGSSVTGRIDGGAGIDTLGLYLDNRVGNTLTGNNSGSTTGTVGDSINFETLNVQGGTWTLAGTQSYQNVGISATAQAIVTGTLTGAVNNLGVLTYNVAGASVVADAISGSGSLVKAGVGSLVLQNGGNSYSGGTSLTGGVLIVGALGAAGSGAISFTTGAETLVVTSAALSSGAFGNNVRSFAADGDVIDVTGVGVGNAAIYNGTTGILTLSGGGITTPVTINIGAGYDGYTFNVAADTGGTGTQVTATAPVPPPVNIWINELHYDNAGTDAGEAVEIAGRAGTDLTGYKLVFYNGSTTPGAAPTYMTTNLTGVIDNEGGTGYGAVSFSYPSNGIQNGANDGIALIAPDGTVIQLLSYEGVFTAAAGSPAAGMTATDIGVSEDGSGALGASLQLTGNGAAGADFTWQPDSTSSFGSLNVGQTIIPDNAQGQVSVSDASVVEGNSGTSNLVFTIHRAGGLGSAASVSYTVNLDGTANAADLGAGAVLTGTVSFAVGAYSATVTIPIQGDTVGEANETLSLVLSNPVGNIAIADGNAVGTIVNDDFVTLTIAQIQGAGHISSYVGQPVQTTGIVTAVDTNGFYMQMAVGDGDAATSDAIFVFTSTAPTVVVGNGVTVGGTVTEFSGGAGALTVTEIANPTVVVNTAVNALPAAVLIGTGGILPPTQNLDDDGLTTFDPVHDGLDFWESLEGMRVTLDAPQAVSNTNSFGETDVVVSGGVGATGVNARGGITISPNADGTVDYNPEKIQIDDDSGVFGGFNPAYTIGDKLSSVTGIVNYSFNYYEVIVTAAVTITQDTTLTRETTTIRGNSDYLTLATYNLENLDPSDNKYTILASDIVYNLRAPDILAVQEVQDADGTGTGGDLSGVSNAQGIIDAIFSLTGMHYGYIEIAPTTTNTSGGEPNGNIRNGYFYNMDRVSYVAGSAQLISDPAYNGSRKPLVATWTFQGENITTVNVHSTSRGGSDPLQGSTQPADAAGDAQRTAQAAAVKAYVNAQLTTNPALNIAVLGDWNGFYFEQAQTQLTDPAQGGKLTNANYLLTPEERYSYVFEGNSQQIDNILVSGNLLAKLAAGQYDALHLNSEFGGTRPTDHDPQLVAFKFGTGANSYYGTNANDTYTLTSPNDRVYENTNGGNDTIVAAFSYDLNNAPNVENLTFSGSAGYEGTGTTGNNVFRGGAGGDRFFGGGGTDTFYGGAGDDVYIVDSADDVVMENSGEGDDTIKSSVSYTLAPDANIENLRLSGTNNNSATGNAQSNVLVGNAGDNTLDGGGGGDRMKGGLGNDTYIVRDASDIVTESDGFGANDVVKAAVSYMLRADAWVETLRTIDDAGTTAIDLTGNDHTSLIVGNAGANHITGGAGNETLTGGGGADIFVFAASVGQDIVSDFVSGTDKLDLDLYFADFAAFQAATTDVGGNAVVDLGNGLTVTLTGVLEAQIQSGDVYTQGNPSAGFHEDAGTTAMIGIGTGTTGYDLVAINHGAFGHGLALDYFGSAAAPMANYLV